MLAFEATVMLRRPLTEVFHFFTKPANLLQLSPPEVHMELVDGPDTIVKGTKLTWKGKRIGVPQQMTVEVTDLQIDQSIVYTQTQGPLAQWIHAQKFSEVGDKVEVRDVIDFAPPGGILGLMVTPALIEQELRSNYDYRDKKLAELLDEN